MIRVGLIGPPDREEIQRLAIRLEERSAEGVVLDPRGDPGIVLGSGEARACGVDLGELRGFYVADLALPSAVVTRDDGALDADATRTALAHSRRRLSAWNALLESLAARCPVINPPQTHDLHGLKPWEVARYVHADVAVPETIATNDAHALAALGSGDGGAWRARGAAGAVTETAALATDSAPTSAITPERASARASVTATATDTATAAAEAAPEPEPATAPATEGAREPEPATAPDTARAAASAPPRHWVSKGLVGGYSYTEPFDPPADVDAARSLLTGGPRLVQERIEGDNVRAFVVGGQIVGAAEIVSLDAGEVDSRRGAIRVRAVDLDATERALVLSAVASWDLAFAAVDLMRDAAERRTVVLECNSAPFFVNFERTTGIDVSSALADALLGRRRPSA